MGRGKRINTEVTEDGAQRSRRVGGRHGHQGNRKGKVQAGGATGEERELLRHGGRKRDEVRSDHFQSVRCRAEGANSWGSTTGFVGLWKPDGTGPIESRRNLARSGLPSRPCLFAF